MRLPVTYLGLGAGALDLIPVRARRRLGAASLVISDEAHRLGAWAPDAERVEARGLDAKAIVARLRAAYEAERPAVRAVTGLLGESMRALDEIRLLLEAEVTLEVLGHAPGDIIRWPWQDRLPLAGKRIAVTRPRAADDELSDLLARLGAEVIEAPALEPAPPADLGPLDRAIDGIHRYAFLVLTSATGVEAFVSRLLAREKDGRWLAGVKLAVVGPGTANALRAHGLRADVAPEQYRGEALANAISAAMSAGSRVLLARAAEGREALPVELAKAGAVVDVVTAYQMVPPPQEAFAPLQARLEAHEIDVVTFASAAAARNVAAAIGVEPLKNATLACLGPVTAEGCEALGLAPAIVPQSARFEDLADAISRHYARERSDR